MDESVTLMPAGDGWLPAVLKTGGSRDGESPTGAPE
jgi:hypothetical protein